MSEDYIIREMVPNDLKDVRKLWKVGGFKLSYSDSIPELKRMLDKNKELCLVLEKKYRNEKQIIGAVLGGFDGRRGWVHHLVVSKSYQRKGYGKKLMRELTELFAKRGIVKIKLEILDSNKEVLEFYRKIGWDERTDLRTMSKTLIK